MASTVLIWNKSSYSSGHASLNIGNISVSKYINNHEHSFVSWCRDWRELNSGNFHDGPKANQNVLHDFTNLGYAPDHIIYIPTSKKSEESMTRHWEAIRHRKMTFDERLEQPETPIFHAPGSNASAVVQRVLKKGDINWAVNPLQWNLNRKHESWNSLHVRDLALSYRGARTISWNTWIGMQDVSYLEKQLLSFFQRYHARHGSSGAKAIKSKPLNVKLLHMFGAAKYSNYGNSGIVYALEDVGNPGARFYFEQQDREGNVIDIVVWGLEDILKSLKDTEFGNYY